MYYSDVACVFAWVSMKHGQSRYVWLYQPLIQQLTVRAYSAAFANSSIACTDCQLLISACYNTTSVHIMTTPFAGMRPYGILYIGWSGRRRFTARPLPGNIASHTPQTVRVLQCDLLHNCIHRSWSPPKQLHRHSPLCLVLLKIVESQPKNQSLNFEFSSILLYDRNFDLDFGDRDITAGH